MNGNAFSSWKVDFLLERCLHNKQNNSNTPVQLDVSLVRCTHLQREAPYRFHQRKIFDTFLTLFDWGAGFFRQFEIYARTRLEITATFLSNHRMNFQEIREKSWSGGNGSALRAVMRYRVEHSRRNSISLRVLYSIYYLFLTKVKCCETDFRIAVES